MRPKSRSWSYLHLNSKIRIKVDREDLPRVRERQWRIRFRASNDQLQIITSVRTSAGPRNISLARFILGRETNRAAIQISKRDQFDYCKSNLATAFFGLKQQKCAKYASTSSTELVLQQWAVATSLDVRLRLGALARNDTYH